MDTAHKARYVEDVQSGASAVARICKSNMKQEVYSARHSPPYLPRFMRGIQMDSAHKAQYVEDVQSGESGNLIPSSYLEV